VRATIPFLLIAAAACGLLSAAEQSSVKRLDGSTITAAEIDAEVTRLMRAAEVTGVGIAILNGGDVAYLKAYGFRDQEKKLPLTEDTVMAGASFSKAVFSYLVMQLVDESLIDLDKPVTQYLPKPLPEYPEYRDLATDGRHIQITAKMLLSHTSGLPNLRQLNDDHKLNINFEPGSRYAYSGEGIQLLQFVVETIMKRPLGDLMRERVFEPLGMTRSSMVSESRFENDLANGYDEWSRSLGPQQRKRAAAAGSMQTTLGDFTRFNSCRDAREGAIPVNPGTHAQSANPNSVEAPVPDAGTPDDGREQADSTELRPRVGPLLDTLQKGLLQGRP